MLLPLVSGGSASLRLGDGPPKCHNLHVVVRLHVIPQTSQHRISHAVGLWILAVEVGDENYDLVGSPGLPVAVVPQPARSK